MKRLLFLMNAVKMHYNMSFTHDKKE